MDERPIPDFSGVGYFIFSIQAGFLFRVRGNKIHPDTIALMVEHHFIFMLHYVR
jgi:hypothetical protein